MLSNGNKQHRKNLSLIDYTPWYTKIENIHKTGKLETKKTTYVLSLGILETETAINEKLGNINHCTVCSWYMAKIASLWTYEETTFENIKNNANRMCYHMCSYC